MGTVYRAWDRELERDVALKWLPAYFSQDQTFTERFKREIRVIAHLEHPHIVPIYDVGENEGRPFIIMRLLDGGTLRDKIQRGNFNLAELVQAIEQIAGALAAAHARQIVHRDIKPGNILFDNHGSAFLSDFGIAKVLDSSTHLTGSGFIGTPAYMSPEQFTGQEIDGRSDQYSLAVVVYEALKGDLPFEGTTAQMMYQHINVVPPDIDLETHPIPPGLNPILLKSLSKNPADRYARVKDFATAMAIAIRMDPATSSVLLPVMVGAPPPGRQRPSTAPTELDTAAEEMDTVGNDYRDGLEALALGEWAAALAAFERVLSVDPNYGNAAGFSRQAQTGLERATAQAEVEKTSIEKTEIEIVPPTKEAAVATAVAIDETMIEPEGATSGTSSHPASQPSDTGLAPESEKEWMLIDDISLSACYKPAEVSGKRVYLPSVQTAGEVIPFCIPPTENPRDQYNSNRGFAQTGAECNSTLSELDRADYYTFKPGQSGSHTLLLSNLPADTQWSAMIFTDTSSPEYAPGETGGQCRIDTPGSKDKRVKCELSKDKAYFIKVSAGSTPVEGGYDMKVVKQ